MNEPEYVDPRTLRPGPIRHESLPPDLLGQIRAVYDVIGPHIDMTLEQFEIDFMRDMHPEREVALWCRIAKAWLAYHEDYLGNETLPNEEERKLLGALVAISTGVEDVSKLNVPAEVGRRLIACYDDPSKE
jgi:hypothetical protein